VPHLIACISGKGGVGKTTTCSSLAGALAQQGQRVLVVDMDPQSNLTSGLKVDPYGLDSSVTTLLIDPDQLPSEVVVHTSWDRLDLLPATPEMSAVEGELGMSLNREFALRDALNREPFLERYDYVFFDTPPNFGFHTINVLAATEYILVPVQMSGYAIKGLKELLRTVHLARQQLNPSLAILGLLATFVNNRTTFSRDMLAGLREIPNLRVFETVISVTVKLQETALAAEPITYYAPSSLASHAYQALAEEVLTLFGSGRQEQEE